ncbi:Glyco_tranf_GTA_type domain containing protein [Candidatus Nanopelagicaceae bacterium]
MSGKRVKILLKKVTSRTDLRVILGFVPGLKSLCNPHQTLSKAEKISKSEQATVSIPGISIFTPTINPIWMLERAYHSLLLQERKDLQWIVVSDGSDEKVASFISGLTPPFEITLIENPKRVGKALSYNKALASATREYFCILDDDDELAPGALENLAKVWEGISLEIRDTFWGVAGISELVGFPELRAIKDDYYHQSTTEYRFIDSTYDEMKFIHGAQDEKLSLNRTAVLKEFDEDDVASHIAPSVMWSKISRVYLMRYTDIVVRVYHDSPEGISRKKRTFKIQLERTLGLVIWTADDLQNNLKYFRHAPIYFFKVALNYVRYKHHLKSKVHSLRQPYNHHSKSKPENLKKTKITNRKAYVLIFLMIPMAYVAIGRDIILGWTQRGSYSRVLSKAANYASLSIQNVLAIRGAIISNIVNLITTLMFQAVLAAKLGISPELAKFYLFLTFSVVVISILTAAFQNTALKNMMEDGRLNVDVILKFVPIALIGLAIQHIVTVIIVLQSPSFSSETSTGTKTFILLLLIGLYSSLQFIATIVLQLLIGIRKFTSAGLLPSIPSLTAVSSVLLNPSFISSLIGLIVGSIFQISVGLFALRGMEIQNKNRENRAKFTVDLKQYFLASMQYVLLNLANLIQKIFMSGTSQSDFALYSLAERNVLSEASLATKGFHQVTLADTLQLDEMNQNSIQRILTLLRTLGAILILTTVSFFILAPIVLEVIFQNGNFSQAEFDTCLSFMKLLQFFICVEAFVIVISNFLFNLRKVSYAAVISSLSTVCLIFAFYLNRDDLSPLAVIRILSINSTLWLLMRLVVLLNVIKLSSREKYDLIITMCLGLALPAFYFGNQILI